MYLPENIASQVKKVIEKLPKDRVATPDELGIVAREAGQLVAHGREADFVDWLICEVYITAIQAGSLATQAAIRRNRIQVNIF